MAIDTPLRRLFDYLPPAEADPESLQVGARLRVPFGRQTVLGILAEVANHSEVPASKLRCALEILDTQPVLDATCFELVRWAAQYYHHPLGEAFAAAIPTLLRQGRPLTATEPRWSLSDTGRTESLATPRLGKRQMELLAILRSGTTVGADAISPLGSGGRVALQGFIERGWVLESTIDAPDISSPQEEISPSPVLNAAQALAVDEICASLNQFQPFLLFGVTGSGKTEVYLQAIAKVLARGDQALVLVPEIALTPQAIARFRKRFAVPLAVLHSAMTDLERLKMWRAARNGSAPLIIGTRSAIFVPLARPGIIIVDEEHDGSYKQQEGFRYSARDLAILRAQKSGIPVVLGSATPALESLHAANTSRYKKLILPLRAGAAVQPHISIIDLKLHESRQGIATPSVLAIEKHLQAGGQVLIYLNRRGFAPALYCTGCGWTAPCLQCDARLTLHLKSHELTCHHCGARQAVPFACPACATELKPMGQGTERVEDTLDELFKGVPVVRIDRDTITSRDEIEAALDRVHTGDARILVGTQMLTKGHDFPNVTLVVILNADQGLFGTDFRASERLAQNIVQVAGRAGRASRPGEVLVQTACPEHPLLVSLLQSGYEGFAETALLERSNARWPPYSRLALLRADAPQRDSVMAFLCAARTEAQQLPRRDVRLLGPAPAAMERRAGRYRAQLLLEGPDRGGLHQLLREWLPLVEALKEARKIRWSVDVDPLETS